MSPDALRIVIDAAVIVGLLVADWPSVEAVGA